MYPKTVNVYVGQIMTLFLFLDLHSIHQKLEIVFILGLLVLGYCILICLVTNKAIKVKILKRINSDSLSKCFSHGQALIGLKRYYCVSYCWTLRWHFSGDHDQSAFSGKYRSLKYEDEDTLHPLIMLYQL